MTPYEDRILSALAAARVTPSVVTLAADLWRGHGDDGDPVGLMTLVLEDLADRGLVSFTIKPRVKGAPSYWSGLPLYIRLTPEGWARAGYPQVHGEVGRLSRHMTPPRHPGDRTDYKTHDSTPTYTPVERVSLRTHEETEPMHYHQHGREHDDPMDALGQWRCVGCGGAMLRSGVCLVGCGTVKTRY